MASLGLVGSLGCGQSQRSGGIRGDAAGMSGVGAAGGAGVGGTGAGGTGVVMTGGTAGTLPIPCGNGQIGDDEECDDGNRAAGDGCSSICLLEDPPCGDGIRARAETCDDGNTASGDGCSGDCRTIGTGYLCTPGVLCSPYFQCGDSRVDPHELCDDGNLTPDDGCFGCAEEEGWKCEGVPSFCHRTVCGDAILEGDEGCDDGGTDSDDGCSADCRRESDCTVNDACMPLCGDGVLSAGEECDDGNLRARDGCSPNCSIEEGFGCENAVAMASLCSSICGDRLITLREECDDGSNVTLYGTDGCGSGCVRAPYCGDGITQPEFGEHCDDGNDRLGPEGPCSGCVLPP